jgi:hypothetical protein
MKLFPNLAAALRTLFGLFQVLIIGFAVLWLFVMLVMPRFQSRLSGDSRLMVSAGQVIWTVMPEAIHLDSDAAKTGSLKLHGLRGMLDADFLSSDAALASALRWTLFPSMAVMVVFSWLLCGSLRTLCGNIACGEVFSETNLRYVRQVGIVMIAYSVVGAVVAFWASYNMSGYLTQHVTISGLQSALSLSSGHGALRFSLSDGLFPNIDGFVAGCLVLVLTQAFRQGLELKNESDLTV